MFTILYTDHFHFHLPGLYSSLQVLFYHRGSVLILKSSWPVFFPPGTFLSLGKCLKIFLACILPSRYFFITGEVSSLDLSLS